MPEVTNAPDTARPHPVDTPTPAPLPGSGRRLGPDSPQPHVPEPDMADRLPIAALPGDPRLWVLGAHGGAGESTLARVLTGAAPTGHRWPATTTTPVLLVARSSMTGLTAARRAATQWASGAAGPLTLLGLVVIADAPGRTPRPLAHLTDLVGGGVPRIWRWPWIDHLRLTPDLHRDATSWPRHTLALFDTIDALIPPPAAATQGDTS
jgi:hypothetical protein